MEKIVTWPRLVSDIFGAGELGGSEIMGCVSSKILAKSGSFQEVKGHSFRRSSVIEEIILSGSKGNGDQFLALFFSSNTAAAALEPARAKIETINVSELLAGLEEENAAEQRHERPSDRVDGGESPAQCAAGRARSFRTLEEFDALVTRGSSSGRAPAPAPELEDAGLARTEESGSSGQEERAAGQGKAGSGSGGAKRRARARQLGELNVPPAFDFSKSGSLRDWLQRGGQIFSPGSYVTPRFGDAPAPAEHGEDKAAEQQPQPQPRAVFDPELVAQFERAMEQLSEDEERVLAEILSALELDTGEKEDEAAAAPPLGTVIDHPVVVAVQQD